MNWWKNLSVSKKLYTVVGAMGLLIALELFTLIFAMRTLSAVRGYVAGEGQWSKSQKDSIIALQNYTFTQDERYYLLFQEYMKVPLGDQVARIEMEKSDFDYEVVIHGMVEGKIHSSDIPEMIKLFRRFYWINYFNQAIQVWKRGDELLKHLQDLAKKIHNDLSGGKIYGPEEIRITLDQISELNFLLTNIENDFSGKLGEASRWLEKVLLITLVIAVITIEGTGLFLTISFSNNLTNVLNELNRAANEVKNGNFNQEVPVRSKDELGQLALALNAMTASLKQQISAVNIRDEFLSVASHELKTPLTTLKLQAQMRRRSIEKGDLSKFEPDKIKKMAEEDENQLNRLIRLVDDMLDVSRLRTGKFALQLEEVNIVKLVKDVFERLSPQIQESGCEITLDSPEAILGYWDSYRLEQVLINLLTNAMKYGNKSPVLVNVKSLDSEVLIAVSDKGIGIKPGDMDRIFEQFERAISSREVSGLGLGLYIAKQIVMAHQGSIFVESSLGSGATFTIKLPLKSKIPEVV